MEATLEMDTEVKTEKTKFDINEMITNKILELIEESEKSGKSLTWKKMWEKTGPKSYVTKKPYRGINSLLLAFSPFKSEYWITWNECKKQGGTVKESERKNYMPIVFWSVKSYEAKNTDGSVKTKKDGTPATRMSFFARYFNVYNIDQCEGLKKIPAPTIIERNHNPIEACESMINNMPNKPSIQFGGGVACYSPLEDKVLMPVKEHFKTVESYYDTFLHELAHSTGHEKRLNRDLKNGFGSQKYSKEELIAQMSASMLSNKAGILTEESLENSAAYLKNWASKLKEDKKMIMSASQAAQKVYDYILGIKFENKEPETAE